MKYPLIPVLLLLHSFAFSQKNFVPGTVVTAKGDSLHGEIDDRNWSRNPRNISFRTGAEQHTYELADLNGFVITGGDHFVKAVVQRSTRPVDIELLRDGFSDTTLTDTVFLRQLVKGKWSLYSLNVDKPLYYFSSGDNAITELQYKIEPDPASLGYFKRKIYRNQLEAVLFQLDEKAGYKRKLERLEYKEKDLTAFFGWLNEGQGSAANQIVREKKQLVHFFAGAGVAFNNLNMGSESDQYFKNLDMGGSVRPAVQAGIDISSGRNQQRLVARVELSWYQFASSGKGHVPKQIGVREKYVEYNLQQSNLRPSVNLLYHIIAYPGFRAYIGAGYALNFASYRENRMDVDEPEFSHSTTYKDYLSFEKTWPQVLLRAGVMFNGKLEAALNYGCYGSFSAYPGYTVKPSSLQLQFNYRF